MALVDRYAGTREALGISYIIVGPESQPLPSNTENAIKAVKRGGNPTDETGGNVFSSSKMFHFVAAIDSRITRQ